MTDFLTEMNQGPLVVPHRIERTGIRRGLLEDLALKFLYLNGEMTLIELSDHLCLSLGVVEEVSHFFVKERLGEVKALPGVINRLGAATKGGKGPADLWPLNNTTAPAPLPLPTII